MVIPNFPAILPADSGADGAQKNRDADPGWNNPDQTLGKRKKKLRNSSRSTVENNPDTNST